MKMFSTRCKNDETFYGMVLKHIFDKQIINGIVDTELATLQHYISHLVSVGIELTLVGGIEWLNDGDFRYCERLCSLTSAERKANSNQTIKTNQIIWVQSFTELEDEVSNGDGLLSVTNEKQLSEREALKQNNSQRIRIIYVNKENLVRVIELLQNCKVICMDLEVCRCLITNKHFQQYRIEPELLIMSKNDEKDCLINDYLIEAVHLSLGKLIIVLGINDEQTKNASINAVNELADLILKVKTEFIASEIVQIFASLGTSLSIYGCLNQVLNFSPIQTANKEAREIQQGNTGILPEFSKEVAILRRSRKWRRRSQNKWRLSERLGRTSKGQKSSCSDEEREESPTATYNSDWEGIECDEYVTKGYNGARVLSIEFPK